MAERNRVHGHVRRNPQRCALTRLDVPDIEESRLSRNRQQVTVWANVTLYSGLPRVWRSGGPSRRPEIGFQSWASPRWLTVASTRSPGAKATLRTSLSLRRNGSRAPVRVSQSWTPLGSSVAAASMRPLWLKATALMKCAPGARAPPNVWWKRDSTAVSSDRCCPTRADGPRVERHAGDHSRVTAQNADHLPARVEDPDRVVGSGQREPIAVGAEGKVLDRRSTLRGDGLRSLDLRRNSTAKLARSTRRPRARRRAGGTRRRTADWGPSREARRASPRAVPQPDRAVAAHRRERVRIPAQTPRSEPGGLCSRVWWADRAATLGRSRRR